MCICVFTCRVCKSVHVWVMHTKHIQHVCVCLEPPNLGHRLYAYTLSLSSHTHINTHTYTTNRGRGRRRSLCGGKRGWGGGDGRARGAAGEELQHLGMSCCMSLCMCVGEGGGD